MASRKNTIFEWIFDENMRRQDLKYWLLPREYACFHKIDVSVTRVLDFEITIGMPFRETPKPRILQVSSEMLALASQGLPSWHQ